MTDEEIVQHVVKRFEASKAYYEPLRGKWADYDQLYFCIPKPKKHKWQSNVFVPATFNAIQTILSKILNVLFSVSPPFDVLGVEEQDVEYAPSVKALVASQLERMGIYEKQFPFILQALVRGTSVGKIRWERKEVTKTFMEPVYDQTQQVFLNDIGIPEVHQMRGELLGYNKIQRQIDSYDDPMFDVIDTNDYFPDPTAKIIEEGMQIHRTIKNYDYLKKNRDIYPQFDGVKDTSFPNDIDLYSPHQRLINFGMQKPPEDIYDNIGGGKKRIIPLERPVELLEAHCDLEVGGKLQRHICVIGNRKALVRKISYPYFHGESSFVNIVFLPVLNELFGQGVPEIAERSQNELNDKRNQRLDNVNQVLQPILTYVENAITPELLRLFTFQPGGRLPVKDINGLRWERCPDVTSSAYKEEDILRQDIEESTGGSKYLGPSADIKEMHKTVSGMALLQGQAGERLIPIIKLMEKMGLEKIVTRFHQLNQQFITREKVIRRIGDQGNEYPIIRPEEIAGNYDFVASGSLSAANKELQIKQLLEFVQIGSQIQGMAERINYEEISNALAGLFGFEKNKFLLTDEQIQEKMLQMQAQQMQQIPQGGMNV